ncbi:hypothetical protein NKR23_g12459 [Pleurostoma richardsiae]|uniref:Uncharacterized protein n=1 Tax=Pleurostoma richardsiae TaxID=41990 RepID=A0AA38R079_9PEZI|nr:hypothetical protein NKR23_g12459 [Pleurostoma richardsiae]
MDELGPAAETAGCLRRRGYPAERADIFSNDRESTDLTEFVRHSDDVGFLAYRPRVTFTSSGLASTIQAVQLQDMGVPEVLFRSLSKAEIGTWWLNIMNPTEGEIDCMADTLSIRQLTIKDVKNPATKEKVAYEEHYYVVCFHLFQHAEMTAKQGHIYAIVFPGGVVTFTFPPTPQISTSRTRGLLDYVALGSDWICCALMHDGVDEADSITDNLRADIDALWDSISVKDLDNPALILVKLVGCRNMVIKAKDFLASRAVLVEKLARYGQVHNRFASPREIGGCLEHTCDHISALTSRLDDYDTILTFLYSAYLAGLSAGALFIILYAFFRSRAFCPWI